MRGVKIDLSSGGSHDTIYLDEESTARTRAALEEIANAVSRSGGVRSSGCMGAKEFWPLYDSPWNKYHELNVDYCGRYHRQRTCPRTVGEKARLSVLRESIRWGLRECWRCDGAAKTALKIRADR